jgi:hypothetical protein
MSGRRFNGARFAARLIGMPIPEHHEPDPADAHESQLPRWLAELDTYEGAEELYLAPDSDIEEMLRARIAGPPPPAEPRAGAGQPPQSGSLGIEPETYPAAEPAEPPRELPGPGPDFNRTIRRRRCPKTTR